MLSSSNVHTQSIRCCTLVRCAHQLMRDGWWVVGGKGGIPGYRLHTVVRNNSCTLFVFIGHVGSSTGKQNMCLP